MVILKEDYTQQGLFLSFKSKGCAKHVSLLGFTKKGYQT